MTEPTHDARRVFQRQERGYSLLEVVVVVGIVGALMVPLFGWMITGMRAADAAERNGDDTFSVALVSAYFGQDIAAAWTVQNGGSDCTGGPGSGGQVVLTTSRTNAGGDVERVAYSVVTNGTRSSLFRRECGSANTTLDSSELAVDITRPASGWPAMVRCTTRPDLRVGACTQVELTIIGRTGRPATFSAVVRLGVPR